MPAGLIVRVAQFAHWTAALVTSPDIIECARSRPESRADAFHPLLAQEARLFLVSGEVAPAPFRRPTRPGPGRHQTGTYQVIEQLIQGPAGSPVLPNGIAEMVAQPTAVDAHQDADIRSCRKTLDGFHGSIEGHHGPNSILGQWQRFAARRRRHDVAAAAVELHASAITFRPDDIDRRRPPNRAGATQGRVPSRICRRLGPSMPYFTRAHCDSQPMIA